MSFGAGKLLLGGSGSVGITTGLVLLVVPYLKPEESNSNSSIVLVAEDETIDPLSPQAEQKDENEQEDDDEEEDTDVDDESIEEPSETVNDEDDSDSSSEKSPETPPTGDDQESEDNEGEEKGDQDNPEKSPSISLPGSSNGGKTRTIRLRLNQGKGAQKSIRNLANIFQRLMGRKS